MIGSDPLEAAPPSCQDDYRKILELALRLPATSVEMSRSPHYAVFCRTEEEVQQMYTGLTSAKRVRPIEESYIEVEMVIDRDYVDESTGKEGRFAVILWNAGRLTGKGRRV